jgi:hypothetical protein
VRGVEPRPGEPSSTGRVQERQARSAVARSTTICARSSSFSSPRPTPAIRGTTPLYSPRTTSSTTHNRQAGMVEDEQGRQRDPDLARRRRESQARSGRAAEEGPDLIASWKLRLGLDLDELRGYSNRRTPSTPGNDSRFRVLARPRRQGRSTRWLSASRHVAPSAAVRSSSGGGCRGSAPAGAPVDQEGAGGQRHQDADPSRQALVGGPLHRLR